MNIYALDENFALVTYGIPYDNLQWTRRYYEAGEFAVQVPFSVFDKSWAYIGTNARPELGIVQKFETSGASESSVLISGFFCEKMLDEKVCFPRYFGDSKTTEEAARKIFSQFKGDLPIELGDQNSPMLGDRTRSDFSDDELGNKLHSILESRELAFRVRYDFVSNKLLFSVWQGLDRTQSQFKNSSKVFSSEFGNLTGKMVNFDDSDYKNYAIVPADGRDSDNVEQSTFYVDLSNGSRKRQIVIDMRSMHPDDGQTASDFENVVVQEAMETLLAYARIEEIDIDVGSDVGYMVDYDLGDKCDVVLSDLGITIESRIIEVSEVFKAADGHTVTVGLGNKRISNVRRAIANI